jgi:type II secretion system protein N
MRQLLKQVFTRQNVLLYGGYTVFFLTCFVLFAYWTFPYDRVRNLLEAEVAASAAPGTPQTKLSIGDLGPHWLSGVAMSAVALEKSSAIADEPPSRIAIDELTLHASPLALLLGSLDVSFGAEIGDGEIGGHYAKDDGEPMEIDAELDTVDLERLGAGSYLGVPLAGTATGVIDVALAEPAAGTQGSVDMRIEKLGIGDGKTKVKIPGMAGGLTIDAIDAGALDLKVAIRDGVATIERLEAKGKDVELSGSGSIRIANPFSQSRADITLAVTFSDAYKQRSDRTKVAFEVMGQNPLIKRATGSDGMMRFKLTGALNNLRSAPAGPASRGPSKSRSAARSKGDEAEGG